MVVEVEDLPEIFVCFRYGDPTPRQYVRLTVGLWEIREWLGVWGAAVKATDEDAIAAYTNGYQIYAADYRAAIIESLRDRRSDMEIKS